MLPTTVYKILAVFFVLSLVGMGTSNAFGQASPSASNPVRISDTEAAQQVLAVDEARRLAMLHSDVSALDSLLSDDVTIFWGDGTADDKASTLALFRSGRLRCAQLDYENTRARLYGEIALLTGQARVKEKSDKESRSYIVRVTRVYVRRQGQWRLVASQTTRVAPL